MVCNAVTAGLLEKRRKEKKESKEPPPPDLFDPEAGPIPEGFKCS